MDVYDLAGACATVREFLEVLTNWYIRRSRERFWAGDRDAIDTLHTVLEVTCRVVAPLLPLTSEMIWRGLTGGRSVHLADWPLVDALPNDSALVGAIDRVRQVCSSALALRTANKLRVRLPLAKLRVAAAGRGAARGIRRSHPRRGEREGGRADDGRRRARAFEVTVNARAAGPRLGKDVQAVIKAVKAGEWTTTPDGAVVAGGIELREGEYERRLVSKDAERRRSCRELRHRGAGHGGARPSSRRRGWRATSCGSIQQARREIGLSVSDRIALTIDAPADVVAAARAHEGLIRSETLAMDVEIVSRVTSGVASKVGDGVDVTLGIVKSSSVTEPDVAVMNAVLVGEPDAEIVALESDLRAAQLAADVNALDQTHRRRVVLHGP